MYLFVSGLTLQFCVWMLRLISSRDYITVLLSLRLLSSVLHERMNVYTAIAFLEQSEALVLVMQHLCSPYQSIQMEAFQVFKVTHGECVV